MSMISTALSGLTAAQRGLEATSNNVANAGTDGYVRRRIIQAESITAGLGTVSNLGSGTVVTGVERLYDSFLGETLRTMTSSEQRAQALADLSTRLDSLLGNPALGISSSLQSFFDKVELLGRDPTSASNRDQLLLQAESLAERFQQLGVQIDALANEVNRRIEDTAGRINTIAAALADINESSGQGAGINNDIIDRRDALIAELSGLIDIKSINQPDGTISIFVGSGQPLVLGIRSATLELTPDNFNPTQKQLVIDFGNESFPITRQISGGKLGGLLSFKADTLDQARQELGLLAMTVTQTFNAQHAQGVDANGALGGEFFSAILPTVATGATNSGSATLTAGVSNAAALAARDYEFRYTGSTWQVLDARTGQSISFSGSGTVGSPFVFEGLSVTVSGAAAAGDRFRVSPVSTATNQFGLALQDAQSIAAAAPVRTGRQTGNLSNATIALSGAADVSNPALLQSAQLRFESGSVFRIYNSSGTDLSGPLTYTSGSNISFNGWTVAISGTPQANDVFTVSATPPGSADNGNALALARVNSQGYLAGGQVSIDDIASRLVSSVGAAALRNQQTLEAQEALREQAQLDVEAISGVNLDEEAANLLRYQQAYQAAGKVIAIADELFQTLLGILR